MTVRMDYLTFRLSIHNITGCTTDKIIAVPFQLQVIFLKFLQLGLALILIIISDNIAPALYVQP